MGHRFPAEEIEFYRRTDEVLHYVWDPIGVSGFSTARDEYYSYLPTVFSMLKDGSSKSDISKYLKVIEEDRMGLDPYPERDANRSKAVDLLFEYRNQFMSNAAEQGAAANP